MQTPHDDQTSLIAFYGDPRLPGWDARNLVPVIPPWRMTYGTIGVSHINFHIKAAPSLRAVFDEIWASCKEDQTLLNDTGLQNYSGAYNPRPIRGGTRLSVHAFGAAIDFDAEHEPMNFMHKSNMALFVINAFKKQGAFWGGDFRSRQDPMHFQFAHE